ncbi:transporter [Odoribacter laneus]|uniref:transporter n=1 Tax=Odoribacter laneus TaxID=626933 RepID=UPI003AB2EB29
MLPIAMLTGALFHVYIEVLSFLTPTLIFCMLFLTFCKISPRNMKFSGLHIWLILIQLAGSLLLYGLIAPFNEEVAEGILICVVAPTATAAAVITGMLGGNVAFLASFVFLSNVTVALTAPVIFSFLGTNRDLSFWDSFGYICRQVVPLLILPLLGAWAVQYILPRLHRWLLSVQIVAFYMWSLALTIVTGRTVSFLLVQENPHYWTEGILAFLALIVCVFQFWLGRRLGRLYGNTIAGGQGLGQKNTILAIWMAQLYLCPAAAVGPAAYVLWQNIINSYQIWKKRKKDMKC